MDVGALRARARWWQIPAAGVLVMLVYALVIEGSLVRSIVYDGSALVCGIAMLFGARRQGRGESGPWYLLAAGVLLWAVGDGIWSYYEEILDRAAPFPSIADAVYLASYPAVALGLLELVRRREPGGDQGALIDSAIVAVAFVVPAWVFWIEPYALDPSQSILYRAVSVSYPLGDIMLVAVAVRLLLSRAGRPGSFWILTGALLTTLVADVWYAIALLEGDYYSGHPMDVLWIAYYFLLATAVLHPSARQFGSVRTPSSVRARRPFGLYLFAATIVPATYVGAKATGLEVNGALMAFTLVAVFPLMMARLRAVFRQVDSQVELLESQRSDLEASEARKSSIVESALDSIVVTDEAGRIVEINPAAEVTFGHRREDVIGKYLSDALIPKRFRSSLQQDFFRRIEEGATDLLGQRMEVTGIHADGTEFPAEFVAASSEDPRYGRTFTAFIRDLTPEKERERLEEQLRQSQKMDAIGQLAGGVAHEFNNLLAVMLSYTGLVRSDLDENDPRSEDLTEVIKAGNRAAELVHQLLAFSRKEVARPEVVDPGEVVAGMEKLLKPLLGEDVSLVVSLEADLKAIEIDGHQLEQVLTNLVVNARDAITSCGSRIEIRVTNERHDDGDVVALRVIDDGCGMREDVAARVFEPFFTTKPPGKGTGLGLSMVYGSVRAAGGSVSVETAPGRGTTATVLLPVSTSQPRRPAERIEPVETGGGETVLVVEDEAGVAAVVRRLLERNGYEVIVAQGPEEGLAVIAERAVDIVLSDVVMPTMSGPEMIEKMRPAGARPATIFMSGYPEDRLDGTGSALLAKPFTEAQLLAALAKVRQPQAGRRA